MNLYRGGEGDEMKIKQIVIWICEDCLNGKGSECHTPGCALCWHKVDIPIYKELYTVIGEIDEHLPPALRRSGT